MYWARRRVPWEVLQLLSRLKREIVFDAVGGEYSGYFNLFPSVPSFCPNTHNHQDSAPNSSSEPQPRPDEHTASSRGW